MGEQEQEQENNGITMWDMVDVVLSADPGHRDEQLLEKLLPWFVARSAVFGGLKKGTVNYYNSKQFRMRYKKAITCRNHQLVWTVSVMQLNTALVS